MNTNKKIKNLLILISVSLLGGCEFGVEYPFKEEAGEMINIVDIAKEEDKDKFLHYQTVEKQEDSNEMIAVVFNTDSEYNVGFIDEYGNVIKEPFLKDPYYDYTNREDGEGGIYSYYTGYFYDYNSESFYDEKFTKVDITNEDLALFNSERNRVVEETYEKMSHEDYRMVKKTLKKLVGDGYETNDYNVGYNGANYHVSFANSSGTVYYILLDEKYNLLTHIYYEQGNESQFSSVKKNSKVGYAFVRDLGLVYYNIYGDIIWITYTK